jgi:hypothetical protein
VEVRVDNAAERIVKLSFNKLAVDSSVTPVVPTGVTCDQIVGTGTFNCETALSSFDITVTLLSNTRAKALQVSAIVTTGLGRDCAVGFATIPISNPTLQTGCAALVGRGSFCFEASTECFKVSGCTLSRKRALSKFRVFPLTYAVSYRRLTRDGTGLSREDSCGPRFAFSVNNKLQLLSPQGGHFLSQGVFSFAHNATLPADGSTFDVDFVSKPIGCVHSQLQLFNEQALIKPTSLAEKEIDAQKASKFAVELDF